ncbi:outer membrane lipoprotein carrier protein LolA [Frigidibacter sp. MR17.14]|uniref:LolA family protein n=1 Tax=Frigidibacter sp. MR17.14 TaxID=3126509 RepID=UPI003012BDF8
MTPLRALRGPALALATLLAAALPALAAPVPLATLSNYINRIDSVQGSFSQLNPDGTRSEGIIKIKRPGRMRFEYTKPDNSLVLAGAGQVAIFDAKSNQPPEQYPLSQTPLNLILRSTVDWRVSRSVVGHGEENGMTTVTVQDPNRPEIGTMTMYFEPSPLRLAQWIVTDEAGGRTLVKLGPLTEADFPPSTFSISDEAARR